MSSARALKKNIDELIKSVKKCEQQKAGASPWTGIDKVQQFLVDHRNDLASHSKQLERISEIQERQVQEVALNLHYLSKSICLNLDDFDQVTDDKEAPESHVRCTNFVNRTAQFIIKDILTKRGLCQRTLRMEFWIAVLNTVFKMGDLQAAGIILTALDNAGICKLTATYKGLSPQAQKILQEMKEFAFKKRSLIIEERTTPVVPAFDSYMRHFIALRNVENKTQLSKYKKQLQKLQAELQFALIAEVINHITADPDGSAERIERWVVAMRDACVQENYRKVLIILNALTSDEVKSVSAGFTGVSFEALQTIAEITAFMRARGDAKFDCRQFVYLSVSDFQPVYFDHEAFTSGKGIIHQDEFDHQARKSVKKLEPNSELKPSPILHNHFPDLFFAEENKLKLNEKVKNRLKQEALNNKIMQINGDKLYQCLRWLQAYSDKQPNTAAGKKRKSQVDDILAQFEEANMHVSHHAYKGAIPNIEENLRFLEEKISDPDVNRHGRTGFIKKWLGKETELALKLKELKEALQETKNLADEQAALVKKYNKKRGEKLSHCIDLMASLANVDISTSASMSTSTGMESGEQTLSADLDISTMILTVSSSESCVSEADLQSKNEADLEELHREMQPPIDVPIKPHHTSNLVRFFEDKAKRNSIAILMEVSKSQRKDLGKEIVKEIKPIISIFAKKQDVTKKFEEKTQNNKRKPLF